MTTNAKAAFNERMRTSFATLALQLRRNSHEQRRWALEANARGDSLKYHEHAALAIRDWRDAREYIQLARNW